ncbi:MAG: hypothetical protein DKM50_10450 [Candidatus Margulisiibacteriota bacterium]|nr:MAG: hypothetical protein A2X43_07155 [Candidatus Margulisbacteria bacterium GWD2_39_127]OGI02943.1 MAG: hypothetical protein A2X42_12680 [Candidatus Margulisbacteria bacterium GWF2_38_17]PZM78736.1 MAG: hypothetical protein DKM50_10450 [Candidatus Margulisiibacteriota bacterium]HAR63362.1 hypothetical protein [Candidatus Margulisiibacteriota bacterium]HCY36415.1 hypothetical protein [Candidatus Margulisiibacteriota bacterium]
MGRIIINYFFLITVLSMCSCNFLNAETITLLFTSNINGKLESCNCSTEANGGLELLLPLVEKERERNPNLVIVDNGGTFLPDNSAKNKYVAAAMNLFKYDAINLDVPADNQVRELPLVSSVQSGAQTQKYISVKKSGVTIIILGVAADKQSAFETYLSGHFSVQKKSADLTVLLSQLSKKENIEIAKKFPWIDIIVSSESEYQNSFTVGQTHFVSAGKDAQFLGKMVFSIEKGTVNLISQKMIPADSFMASKKLKGLMLEYYKELRGQEKQKDTRLSRDIIYVFSNSNCAYCHKLRTKKIPQVLAAHNKHYEVVFYPLEEPDNYKTYMKIMGNKLDLPALYFNGLLLAGKTEIERQLDHIMREDAK